MMVRTNYLLIPFAHRLQWLSADNIEYSLYVLILIGEILLRIVELLIDDELSYYFAQKCVVRGWLKV